MPKLKKGYTTPHVCVPITNPRRDIPSEHDQQARFRFLCSVLDSCHTEIQGPVFLSVGPEAKLNMFNNFDLDNPFDLYLEPLLTFILQMLNQESGSSLPHQQMTCMILVPVIVLYLCHTLVSSFTANLNSTELHLQGVAPRSQYSDPTPEVVTLQ